jgi:hypothetical protein
MLAETVTEMDYLRIREQKLRDTNESTNTRVKWFGFCTTFLLIGLWGWQIMYLRAYFRWVMLAPLFLGSLLIFWVIDRSILFNARLAGWFLDCGFKGDWSFASSYTNCYAGEHGIMKISGVLYMDCSFGGSIWKIDLHAKFRGILLLYKRCASKYVRFMIIPYCNW